VRSLVVTHKTSSAADAADVQSQTFHLCSRLPGSAAAAERMVRGHWAGCEIRNHWVRDALWMEDKTRSKNWELNANLAVMRAGLIALKAECVPELSWPALFELSSYRPRIAFNLLTQHRFK